MSTKVVFCLASSATLVEQIANKIRAAGFSEHDISVLFPDETGLRGLNQEEHTKAPEGAATGASAGGVLGGGLGWLIEIGSLAIPGVGPFIAAGPIMAALAGAAVGAAAGGLTGALVGLGIPEYEATQYEGKIREGSILISVHADEGDEVDRATEIFKREGAHDISCTPWEWRPGLVMLWADRARHAE
jgi:uncharacterized membrane protein